MDPSEEFIRKICELYGADLTRISAVRYVR